MQCTVSAVMKEELVSQKGGLVANLRLIEHLNNIWLASNSNAGATNDIQQPKFGVNYW